MAELVDRLEGSLTSPLDLLSGALKLCVEDIDSVLDDKEVACQLFFLGVDSFAARLHAGDFWPQAGQLRQALNELETDMAPILSVHTMGHIVALAVDQEHIGKVRAEIEVEGRKELTENDLVLRSDLNLHARFKSTFPGQRIALGPRREHSESSITNLARTPNAQLYRNATGAIWRTVMNYLHSDELANSLPALPPAAAIGPLGKTDPRLEGTRTSRGVFGLGPADQHAAWGITLSALQNAASDGALIAVVPELNVGPDIDPGELLSPAGDTNSAVTTNPAVPALILSGSRHCQVDGKSFNEAQLHLNGRPVLAHRKIRPFDPLRGDQVAEDIDSGRILELIWSPSWNVATLICADVNEQLILDELAQLSATLILVSSMTPSLGYFQVALNNLVLRTQGIAVWANDPGDSKDVPTSAFVFPSPRGQWVEFSDQLPSTRIHDWS